MSDKEVLEVFTICERLAELLGDNEAIADLKTLLERHPEMFKDMEEVKKLIEKVIAEPEIIIKNSTPQSEKDYIAGKKLNEEKMGEVGIRRDENINKIFHANEKRLKNLDLMTKKDAVVDGRDAHTPYIQAQSLDGRLVENNISSTATNIIPQSKDNPTQNTLQNQNLISNDLLSKLEANQQTINQSPRVDEILKNQDSTKDSNSQDSKDSALEQNKRKLK